MQLLLAEPILQAYQAKITRVDAPKTLAIIVVGDDVATQTFIGQKQRRAEEYGINTVVIKFPVTVKEAEVAKTVQSLNAQELVTGIVLQLPLPAVWDTNKLVTLISPGKDVDSLRSDSPYLSPMAQAVAALLEYYQLSLANKKIVVVGQGRLVGQPITAWLTAKGFTPSVVDENTANVDEALREADVIFAGTGHPNLIAQNKTRERQIIFDCSGVDVDFEAVKNKSEAITPPKGAIGPLTVHFLLLNALTRGEKS